MKKFSIFAVAGAIAVTATVAFAAVTFDPETGEGFVGKGDVQEALGWNNRQLQNNPDPLVFTASSVSQTTWLCRHDTNQNAADQERSTTVTTRGLVSAEARERNQITGFYLEGYTGTPTVVTDGPEVGTCQAANRSLLEGSIEEGEASAFTLFVNGVALQ
jgi:hypothetical protein